MTAPSSAALSAVPSERLAVHASTGNREALTELFERHDAMLFAYSLRRVRTRQAAEDVCGEVWLRVTDKIHTFSSQGDGSFCAWLLRIAKNLILTRYRSQQRKPEIASEMLLLAQPCPDAGPAEVVECAERARLVAAAMQTLTARQRECITLRYFDDLTEAETAAVMGQTVGAVKLLQFRAKKTMRKALGPVMLTEHAMPAVVVASRRQEVS